MKTFLECVGEAAQKQGDEGFMNWLIFKLDHQQLEQLARAADIYAEQSNSHKHSIMQAEVSDGAEVAAVGQRSVGKSVSVCNCRKPWGVHINGVNMCAVCELPIVY